MADVQNSINIASAFAKKWEGLASKSPNKISYFSNIDSLDPNTIIYPYKDTSRGYSIGYGSFTENNNDGSNDLVGTTTTKAKSDEMLKSEMSEKESNIRNKILVNLNDYQYAAILDYVYNAGTGAINYNNLLDTINNGGDVVSVLKRSAITADGNILSVLKNRRIDEGLLWNGELDSIYSKYLRNADFINGIGISLALVGTFIYFYVKYKKKNF